MPSQACVVGPVALRMGASAVRWQRENAGVRLVHGAHNALRQGVRLLFMG
jgi:hypothetical protein